MTTTLDKQEKKPLLTRTQRRKTSLGVQYAVFLIVVLAVVFSADWPRLAGSFMRGDIAASMFPTVITTALVNTAIYTVCAFVLGLVLGLVVALMRLSSVGPYRWVATAYVEIFRGLPALLWLFMVAYGLPNAFPDYQIAGGYYGQVALGLGMPAAAYMSETIRAGIQAVPKGQLEAARTLGMSHFRAMTSIVLPQAFRIVIPPLTNELILLIKDSSLAYVLGVTIDNIELTKFGGDLLNTKVNPTPLVVAGLCYLILTLPLSQLVRRLEMRFNRAR